MPHLSVQVCLVGAREFNTFGSHGSDAHVTLRYYKTLEECCDDLRANHGAPSFRQRRIAVIGMPVLAWISPPASPPLPPDIDSTGCEVVGVEIVDSAKPINSHPFSRSVAFMLGNEGQGLSERQIRACDSFVYIPQYGVGTASLNVAVAASIVLHHFGVWAGYAERSRTGYKFDVAEREYRRSARGVVPLTEAEAAVLRASREAARAAGEEGLAVDFNAEGPLELVGGGEEEEGER